MRLPGRTIARPPGRRQGPIGQTIGQSRGRRATGPGRHAARARAPVAAAPKQATEHRVRPGDRPLGLGDVVPDGVSGRMRGSSASPPRMLCDDPGPPDGVRRHTGRRRTWHPRV